MNRYLALLLALLFASVSVASACSAAPTDLVRFKLEPADRGGGSIQATFRSDRPNRENNWSTDFAPSELIGLDVAGFRAVGTRPLRFAIAREAGRLDCSGQGGNSFGSGYCSFGIEPRFAQLLQSRGIAQPSSEEGFALMAVNVGSDLINQLAAARYPTPTVDQLIAMTAVGVSGEYINGLARVGYRPTSIDSLVQFRALNITPEYIGGFVRIGYSNIDPNELIQLKALNVTADYVAAFRRLGYSRIAPTDLVQLKALNVTADYVAGFERLGYRNLPVDKLVQLKALDITPEFVQQSGVRPDATMDVDALVQRKIFGQRR